MTLQEAFYRAIISDVVRVKAANSPKDEKELLALCRADGNIKSSLSDKAISLKELKVIVKGVMSL